MCPAAVARCCRADVEPPTDGLLERSARRPPLRACCSAPDEVSARPGGDAECRKQSADRRLQRASTTADFTSVARGQLTYGRYEDTREARGGRSCSRRFGRQFAHKLNSDFCSRHRLQTVSRCQAENSRGCKADCNFTRMTRIDQNAGLHHLRMLSLVADVHCAWHTEISRDSGGLPLLRKEKAAFSGEFAKLRMSGGSECCIMQTGVSLQIANSKRSEPEFCDVANRILRTEQNYRGQNAHSILNCARVVTLT